MTKTKLFFSILLAVGLNVGAVSWVNSSDSKPTLERQPTPMPSKQETQDLMNKMGGDQQSQDSSTAEEDKTPPSSFLQRMQTIIAKPGQID